MVDTVLHFEGDRHYSYRILRTLKNRFGSTDELSIYEMSSLHLKSKILLSQHVSSRFGRRTDCCEHCRAAVITPQRGTFDARSMLLAVLEKRWFHIDNRCFFSWYKINDPALAVIAAVIFLEEIRRQVFLSFVW
jgi:DNA repair protein RadA/Sms